MNSITDVLEENATKLAECHGWGFLPGSRRVLLVKQVPRRNPTHLVCLYQTLFNWRLVQISLRHLDSFERGWCYTGAPGFGLAVGEALQWPDDDDGTHVPQFWYRDINGDVRRDDYLFS